MGHTNTDMFQAYISHIVAIDTQSLVEGREPKTQLIESNTSMSIGTNNQAPHQPGTRLTDVSSLKRSELIQDADGGDMKQLSNTQQCDLRRRLRHKMYMKERKDFFAKAEDAYDEVNPDDEIEKDKHITETRTPSRYLQALLLHNTNRQKLIDLLYNQKSQSSTILRDCVEVLHKMADPARERTVYRGVELPKDGHCPHCNVKLNVARPEQMNRHLMNCSRQNRKEFKTKQMREAFETELQSCRWNDCGYRFKSRGPGSYSIHVTSHLASNRLHQCLWN
jgi:hypothetical protein